MSTGCALDSCHLAGHPYSLEQASMNPWHGLQAWHSYGNTSRLHYCWHGHALQHLQS